MDLAAGYRPGDLQGFQAGRPQILVQSRHGFSMAVRSHHIERPGDTVRYDEGFAGRRHAALVRMPPS